MRTAFEREGDVRSVDLLGAFATLWRERASGVVDFSGPGRTVRFDVSDGEIVAASSSDGSFETAEILRRAEKLSAEALADGRIPTGSDRARYLRDIGLLSDRDWRWGEKLRIVEILSDLVGWLDGTYRYQPAATLEPSDFQIGIHRVVLELYLRSSDRAFIHHSLGAPDAALERAADFDEKFSSLGLTPDALAVAAARSLLRREASRRARDARAPVPGVRPRGPDAGCARATPPGTSSFTGRAVEAPLADRPSRAAG
jgi:hypothetical protein